MQFSFMSSVIHNKSIFLLYKVLKSRTIVTMINIVINDIMQRKQNQVNYKVFRFRCDTRTKYVCKRKKAFVLGSLGYLILGINNTYKSI